MSKQTDWIEEATRRATSTDHPMVVPTSILHPAGLIGVPCGQQARWTQFWMCLKVLEMPKGSGVSAFMGTYIQATRNDLAQAMLDSHAQWLFMVDDDHTFDRRLLINLLDRHVPVVGAAAMSRTPPFYVCAYRPGENHAMAITEFDGEFEKVDAVGTGAILIRREVFEALDPPWFEVGFDDRNRNVSEDVTFCRRARDAGFDVWLDGTQAVGHMTGMELEPSPDGIKIAFDSEQGITIPRSMIDVQIEEEVA